MGGNSRSNYFSGKEKASSRGKGKFDYVVLIDDDGDQLDDVVVIDGESDEGNLNDCADLKGKKGFPFEGIINIDDDDDDEDDSDANPGVHWGTELDGDTSSSKRSPPFNFMWRSVGFDDDDDDCQVIHEKKSAFGLSKCKQAEPQKPTCEKGYGFSPQSMSSSEEIDCSDCEVIESLAEDLHQKWEKSSKRRKYYATSSQLDPEDQKDAFQSHFVTPPDVQARNRTEDCAEAPVSSGPEESTYSETCSSATPEINSEDIFHKGRVPFDCPHSNETLYEQPFSSESQDPFLDSISSRQQCGTVHKHLHSDGTFHCQTGTFMDREKFKETDEYKQAAETEWASRKRTLQLGRGSKMARKRKAQHQQAENLRNTKENGIIDEEIHDQSETVCDANAKAKETSVAQSFSAQVDEQFIDSMDDQKICEPRDPHDLKCDNNDACGQRETIIDREKLKESEEYKQAAEAEWLARQREIKLQAQEAQRLRRKIHAEKRMLDMERRQKQRVEEMRETEKKDKENMNLKEQLRIEVRKNLSKLELSCNDMASLLRGLGVHLAEGSNPSTHEVHAAYKRALLRFHPDRSSRTDIRQQVEAEEKFKLICRMKERYLSAPCR